MTDEKAFEIYTTKAESPKKAPRTITAGVFHRSGGISQRMNLFISQSDERNNNHFLFNLKK
ncbi:MAG: hypothetical protein Q8867_10165 [Bacteroidota bacterium]|nr:hypothetical protein [Bacteroidota bacterium]